MINVENLSITISNKQILNNINVEIRKHRFTAIVGPNGCGKSTLIKVIAGILKKDSGVIQIDHINKEEYTKKSLAQKIAYLMQFNDSANDLLVKDIVAFGREPYIRKFKGKTSHDLDVINWAIDVTNIKSLVNEKVNNLSGGEKQRVYLAMALAQEPEVLILDEPTNHLDVKYQLEMLNLIKELNLSEKITVVCVLHDLNQALRYADDIVVMNEGKIITAGAVCECLNETIIKQIYDVNCSFHCGKKHKYIEVY